MKTAGRSLTGALIAALALAACQAPPPKPMETVEDTVEVSATVEKVDVLNRLLTLKTESGEMVTVEVDPAIGTVAAAVDITAGGRTYNLVQDDARGSDRNPMSDKDLEDKLRTSAAGWDATHDIAPLINAVWTLEKSADVSKLAALAVPR